MAAYTDSGAPVGELAKCLCAVEHCVWEGHLVHDKLSPHLRFEASCYGDAVHRASGPKRSHCDASADMLDAAYCLIGDSKLCQAFSAMW